MLMLLLLLYNYSLNSSDVCPSNKGFRSTEADAVFDRLFPSLKSFNPPTHPDTILLKSVSGRCRSDRIPVGPITVRYRFKQNASSPYVQSNFNGSSIFGTMEICSRYR